MRYWIRGLALVLLCVLLCFSAVAEGAFVPEMQSWDWDSMPIRVTLKADVQTHMPYDKTRTQQLNALIRHMTLKLHSQRLSGESWSRVTLAVDDEDVLSMLLRETPAGAEAQFSTDPYATYTWSAEDGLDLTSLLGGESADLWINGSETSWMDDALLLFDAMTQTMTEQLTDNKCSITIEKMGTAKRKQVLTIPKSEAEGLAERMVALCPEGELRDALAKTIYSGLQVLTLWRAEDGQILRADWAGNAGFSQDDLRQVSLTWRLCRGDALQQDELTLKTPKAQGSGRNNLIVSRKVVCQGDEATLTMKLTKNVLKDGSKTIDTASFNLKRVTEDGQSRVTGEIDCQRQIGDDDAGRILIQPDVLFAGTAEEPYVTGQALVSQYDGKNVLEQANITFDAQGAEWMMWELRPSQVVIDTENRDSIAQRLLTGMTVPLVRRMVLLPEEDTLFLSDGLDSAVWQQIVEEAQRALQQEVLP